MLIVTFIDKAMEKKPLFPLPGTDGNDLAGANLFDVSSRFFLLSFFVETADILLKLRLNYGIMRLEARRSVSVKYI
jgi:hypothetical protein